jgi:hypothetical protein
MTTFELIVVGMHPITTNPTKMTGSIDFVPEADITITMPKTKDENAYI